MISSPFIYFEQDGRINCIIFIKKIVYISRDEVTGGAIIYTDGGVRHNTGESVKKIMSRIQEAL